MMQTELNAGECFNRRHSNTITEKALNDWWVCMEDVWRVVVMSRRMCVCVCVFLLTFWVTASGPRRCTPASVVVAGRASYTCSLCSAIHWWVSLWENTMRGGMKDSLPHTSKEAEGTQQDNKIWHTHAHSGCTDTKTLDMALIAKQISDGYQAKTGYLCWRMATRNVSEIETDVIFGTQKHVRPQ